MKRIALLGAVALGVGLAQDVVAAELPVYGAAPVYQAPVAVAPTWTGIYLGFNAGWGWPNSDEGRFAFTGIAVLDVRPSAVTFSSPVFGGQFGYNLQTGSWVWGVETDVDGAHMRAEKTVTIPAIFIPLPPGTASLNVKQDWLASLKARVGYTWGPGMVYVAAGMAWTGLQIDGNATFGGPVPVFGSFTQNRIKSGTVIGTGYEWMIAPNWSARAEYLFYNFTGAIVTSNQLTAANATVNTGTSKFHDSVVRIGLDYKFDWGAPVATRY